MVPSNCLKWYRSIYSTISSGEEIELKLKKQKHISFIYFILSFDFGVTLGVTTLTLGTCSGNISSDIWGTKWDASEAACEANNQPAISCFWPNMGNFHGYKILNKY